MTEIGSVPQYIYTKLPHIAASVVLGHHGRDIFAFTNSFQILQVNAEGQIDQEMVSEMSKV